MMTGLLPQQHGADGHMRKKELSFFDSKLPTLQKVLKGAGYRTAGFVTNPFLHTWNAFHVGFDHYDASFINSAGNRKGGLKVKVWVPETMFGDTVNKAIFDYYDATPRDAPEFTYVHYIDVHGPYWKPPFEPNLEAAIAFTDARIIEIYEYFMQRYDGDLVFIVTSDHGKALGDDMAIGDGPLIRKDKGSLYDFNLRIPFMVLPSKRVAQRVSVDAPCSNIDITPTIADWAGIELPVPVPGISLLPAIGGDSTGLLDRPLYSRVSSFRRLSDGMFLDGKKYIRNFDYKSKNLLARYVFDLESDPREESSISDDFGNLETVLESAAGTHGHSWPAHFGVVPTDTRSQLESLGYLSSD